MPSKGQRVPIGLLRINVISAKNLPKMDVIGSADPYVILKLGTRVPQEAKTKIIFKNLNPCWEEQFVFEVTNATSTLRVEVWDHDLVGEDDPIGFFDISLKYLAHEQIVTSDFFLKKAEVATEEKNEDTKEKPKEKKKGNSIWDGKTPPKIRLQLRYCYSRLGEMASHWNPEPLPPPPEETFDMDKLYGNLMILLDNIWPIVNFFYAFYMVLCWEDVYYSAWVTFCFIICCFHPWMLALILQGWLIHLIATNYVKFAWKKGHTTAPEAKSNRIISSAEPEPEPTTYSLGMVGGPLVMAIKASGYEEDMVWYQSKLGLANWLLESIYFLFDWSSPATTRAILSVLTGMFLYSLVFPVHYLTLVIGLYMLFMWTGPFMFIMWAISGFGRYFGREKISSDAIREHWKSAIIDATAMSKMKKARIARIADEKKNVA